MSLEDASKNRDVVLITGQQWVSFSFFAIHYEGPIRHAWSKGAHFVVGAADGIDRWAQALLSELAFPESQAHGSLDEAARVTVFDKGDKDGRVNTAFKLSNGYDSYQKRGEAMAKTATRTICVLAAYGAASSGALQDLLTAELKDAELAAKVLATLRDHSESQKAFEAMLPRVKQIYTATYDEKAIEKRAVEHMAKAAGMKFVNM